MGKVKIITNGTGNIINLIGNGHRGEICDMNPDMIINKIINASDRMWDKKLRNAYNWVTQQNWSVRVNEWLELIKQLNNK